MLVAPRFGFAASCVLALLSLCAAPAAARSIDPPLESFAFVPAGLASPSAVSDDAAGPVLPADANPPSIGPARPSQTAPVRPRLLMPLYLSFAALQGLDVATTIRALDRGAVEANPVMGGIAGNRSALIAVKSAVGLTTILLNERLWKRNRVAAIVTMVALNGAYAAIVAHNYRAVK